MKRRDFFQGGIASLVGLSGLLRASNWQAAPATEMPPPAKAPGTYSTAERHLLGWGWREAPHGQTLASDVLGQLVGGDPARPHYGLYGPNGGANDRGFFFYAAMGRTDTVTGLAAHLGLRKLAVPDTWNHRVLLFDLRSDGSLASRVASGIIGQAAFDAREIGQGPGGLHYPAACTFDPNGRFLFVADEHNNRVLQYDMASLQRAVRVYGQPDFDSWGYDAQPGDPNRVLRDSLRSLYGYDGPFPLHRHPSPRGFFLPSGLACDGKRLFVSDCDNHRVLVFDISGTENGPAAIAVLGQPDFDGFKPNRGGAAGPTIKLMASSDRESLNNFYGKPGPDTMLFPTGLALDRTHRYLLVADCQNDRALVFDVGKEIRNGMPAVAVVRKNDDVPAEWRPADKDFKGIVDVVVDETDRVFVSDRKGLRVLVYSLASILSGKPAPEAALGRFEMLTDLEQVKGLGKAEGPTGLAIAGRFLYVAEPRASRVLCYDTSHPARRAVNVLGQSYAGDSARPSYNQYGHNGGANPYGFSLIDGVPGISVSEDGQWLLASDSVGGRVLFFPLASDGLPLDRYARFTLGAPDLTTQVSNYGPDRFARPCSSVMTADGRVFITDFSGARILYFELPGLTAASGKGALDPLRPNLPSPDGATVAGGAPGMRGTKDNLLFHSITCGAAAKAVLGQVDFYTSLRNAASISQLGKEISGLAFDRKRGWLIITDKQNNRVVIMDVSKGVKTFMPAFAVLGQADFDSNGPYRGKAISDNDHDRVFIANDSMGERATKPAEKKVPWHPAGLKEPKGAAYDHVTQMFFVVNDGREILGFDLSGPITNGMAPAIRIGGAHSTVETDLPFVGEWLGIDEERRRLWSDGFALDISGNIRKSVPLIGQLGDAADRRKRPEIAEPHGGPKADQLGYSVPACHRFGGNIDALAVNPRTGTVYMMDNARFRVLCFQPEFKFDSEPLRFTIGAPAIGLTGTGGMAPLNFTLSQGALPRGLTIDSKNGVISGNPSDRPGEYRVEISVRSASGNVQGDRHIVLEKA